MTDSTHQIGFGVGSGNSPILDLNDPRLDDYRFLRDRDLSGARRNEGLFVGETLPILTQMLAIPGVTRSILASQRMAERAAQVIAHGTAQEYWPVATVVIPDPSERTARRTALPVPQ